MASRSARRVALSMVTPSRSELQFRGGVARQRDRIMEEDEKGGQQGAYRLPVDLDHSALPPGHAQQRGCVCSEVDLATVDRRGHALARDAPSGDDADNAFGLRRLQAQAVRAGCEGATAEAEQEGGRIHGDEGPEGATRGASGVQADALCGSVGNDAAATFDLGLHLQRGVKVDPPAGDHSMAKAEVSHRSPAQSRNARMRARWPRKRSSANSERLRR